MDMNDEDVLSEDDFDEEDIDDEEAEEAEEEDDGSGESFATESRIGYCRICGAEVIVDELPDSISKDAFHDFGLCLNCQWGFFMDNGGHF
jgi:hypothetical protein